MAEIKERTIKEVKQGGFLFQLEDGRLTIRVNVDDSIALRLGNIEARALRTLLNSGDEK